MIRVFQAISDPTTCHAVVAKREGGSGDEIPLSIRGDSRVKKASVIERNIGSLKQKSPSVHRFYDIKHENQTLVITRLNDKIEEALSLCGDYVLKINQSLDAETLWYLYMPLLKAEKGFRMYRLLGINWKKAFPTRVTEIEA